MVSLTSNQLVKHLMQEVQGSIRKQGKSETRSGKFVYKGQHLLPSSNVVLSVKKHKLMYPYRTTNPVCVDLTVKLASGCGLCAGINAAVTLFIHRVC